MGVQERVKKLEGNIEQVRKVFIEIRNTLDRFMGELANLKVAVMQLVSAVKVLKDKGIITDAEIEEAFTKEAEQYTQQQVNRPKETGTSNGGGSGESGLLS